MTSDSVEGALQREAALHDAHAAALAPEDLPPRVLDDLEENLLTIAGPVDGLAVLDLGCGSGELSLELLRLGAKLSAIDVSAGMVEVARRRAQLFRADTSSEFFVGDAAASPFEDAEFDLIVGKWILHHLDLRSAAAEIKRLLRPGGRAVFVENQGVNPVLRFAREKLVGRFGIPRLGSEDEHPLMEGDYALLRETFPSVEIRYPDFCFVRLFDRQIVRQRSRRFSAVCRALDCAVYRRAPRLRRYSFHVILAIER